MYVLPWSLLLSVSINGMGKLEHLVVYSLWTYENNQNSHFLPLMQWLDK
jgi:hypothetical protein